MPAELGSLESLAGVALHTAMQNTGVGIVCCDAQGRLTLLSPMLQELFGLPFAPLEEQELPDTFRLFAPDGTTPLPAEDMPIARARAGEYVRDAVVAARGADGRLVHLQCNAAPLFDETGQLAGAMVLAQDVSAQQAAAVVTEELRQRVVQMVNHEFRTPLTALLGHLELVREHRDQVPPEVLRSLAAIERAGWRLSDLVCTVAQLIDREEELHRAGRTPDGAPRRSGAEPVTAPGGPDHGASRASA